MILLICAVLLAYCLGSINFAVIFSNIFLKRDIRKLGSGNAGATNVYRNAGTVPGILTFLCDALKGYLASFAGMKIFEYVAENHSPTFAVPIYGAYICGVACMIGHVFPLFFGFKGGKGVAVGVGIFYVCCPPAISLGLVLFIICVLLTKIVSVSSLTATAVTVIGSMIFYKLPYPLWIPLVSAICMGLIIYVRHKDNIARLLKGEESKIGGKKNG